MKPVIVKKPKVEIVKISRTENKNKVKKLPKLKPVPSTRRILTESEKTELANLFKIVQSNRESVHGKTVATVYDTGLRTHSRLEIKCVAGTHISFELISPRYTGSLLTNNTTDLRLIEKAVRKARRYIENNRKIRENQ